MRICKVKGCGKKHKARGYCNKHVNQIYAHGRILKRNRLDPNDIISRGNNAIIILRNTLGDKIGETVIDENDLNIAKKHKWHLNNTGYAVTRIDKSKQVLLHRMLTNPGEGKSVDHINGDTLDNRRENLRVCTHQQNMYNAKIRKDNTSGVSGVSFDKRKNLWRSRINYNKKEIFLGYFKDFDSAANERLKAEKRYYGEFRRKQEN